jgi:hypothetical protein
MSNSLSALKGDLNALREELRRERESKAVANVETQVQQTLDAIGPAAIAAVREGKTELFVMRVPKGESRNPDECVLYGAGLVVFDACRDAGLEPFLRQGHEKIYGGDYIYYLDIYIKLT